MPLELSTAAFLMERERASKQKLFSSAAAFRNFLFYVHFIKVSRQFKYFFGISPIFCYSLSFLCNSGLFIAPPPISC